MIPRWLIGELVGTFLLVFFGCGAVATSVALGAPMGLFQVAIVWGLGLSVAIFLTGGLSGAHLNPAITLAFAVFGGFPKSRIAGYILAQFGGAFLAAVMVYLLFGGAISAYERSEGIVRNSETGVGSAMIFGEYYPNPGGEALTAEKRQTVGQGRAFLGEFLGTAILAFAIFGFVNPHNKSAPDKLVALAIGMTLTTLICIFAPLTMAGFNPARDLAPRVFSSLAGWGSVPFTINGTGWLTVYVVAPLLGALAGSGLAVKIFSKPDQSGS